MEQELVEVDKQREVVWEDMRKAPVGGYMGKEVEEVNCSIQLKNIADAWMHVLDAAECELNCLEAMVGVFCTAF